MSRRLCLGSRHHIIESSRWTATELLSPPIRSECILGRCMSGHDLILHSGELWSQELSDILPFWLLNVRNMSKWISLRRKHPGAE